MTGLVVVFGWEVKRGCKIYKWSRERITFGETVRATAVGFKDLKIVDLLI